MDNHHHSEKPAAIILAAGASSRMGENKMLKQWRGKPLLCYALGAAMDAKKAGLLSFVAAVCGRDARQTAKLLAAADAVVCNADYRRGIASSLICGLDALPNACCGVVVFLGDMPCICRADIAAVITLWQKSDCDIAAAAYQGKRGHPVLLSARVFNRVRKLSGDAGARALFDDCDMRLANAGRGVLTDMDTPEQMKAAF
ncbi:MAG: nucleotidyltransferase family protein [Gammaproteobacteria bacterium]